MCQLAAVVAAVVGLVSISAQRVEIQFGDSRQTTEPSLSANCCRRTLRGFDDDIRRSAFIHKLIADCQWPNRTALVSLLPVRRRLHTTNLNA